MTRDIALFRQAAAICREIGRGNQLTGADCGWRGDHRDATMIAEHLGRIEPSEFHAHVAEAVRWIQAQPAGLPPTTTAALNHLRRRFGVC